MVNAETIRARVDRQYRADVKIENAEKMTAIVTNVPQGGAFNAGDLVELAQPKKTQNVKVEKERPDGTRYETLEERETGEPDGDPHIVKLIARKYERRTFIRWKPGQDPAAFVKELGKRGWPFLQLEAPGCAMVAHPRGTRVSDTAKVCGLELLADEDGRIQGVGEVIELKE